MARIAPFEAQTQRYDAWFEQHQAAYVSELLAVRALMPWSGWSVEIGVGTGRFAAPLGVQVGLDPSPAMLALAAGRGIDVVEGTAENVPFPRASFDSALAVTTLCFVDSPTRMFAEAHRVLRPGGRLVVGFIDRGSSVGEAYARQPENVFYREAAFHSAAEVEQLLHASGFAIRAWGQTLAQGLEQTSEIEPLQPGHGRCAFVVVSAWKTPAVRR